jgi:quercetin dioxygenase-like cupin family protein
MSETRVLPWSGEGPPSKDAICSILKKEGLEFYSWSNGPGDEYGVHTHSYFKIIYVFKGSITMDFPEDGQRVTMNPGDRLELTAGVSHSALVGPEGVSCFESLR